MDFNTAETSIRVRDESDSDEMGGDENAEDSIPMN
jgi:hypothetical protein